MVVPPDLPAIPTALEIDCKDPGVPEIQTVDVAIAVLVSTRIWAVCERQKHHDSNQFYRDVRLKLSSVK